MSNLYFDCYYGAAGDLIMSALYELLPQKDKVYFIDTMNKAGIPTVHFNAKTVSHYNIDGTHIQVMLSGSEEHQGLSGWHYHTHHSSSMADIESIVSSLLLPINIKNDVMAVYNIIANAESAVHGKSVCDIHFHEVGRNDAIADIAGVSLLINMLSPVAIESTAVSTGYGKVVCAHGELDVPAPATKLILDGMPINRGSVEGELCTPTGAALIKHFVTAFNTATDIPIGKTGIGFGTKDFGTPTYVKAVIV